MQYNDLACSVHQLEYDKEQVHSDLRSKQRQLSDLAAAANDLKQQLAYVRHQLTSAEKEVSLLCFTTFYLLTYLLTYTFNPLFFSWRGGHPSPHSTPCGFGHSTPAFFTQLAIWLDFIWATHKFVLQLIVNHYHIVRLSLLGL